MPRRVRASNGPLDHDGASPLSVDSIAMLQELHARYLAAAQTLLIRLQDSAAQRAPADVQGYGIGQGRPLSRGEAALFCEELAHEIGRLQRVAHLLDALHAAVSAAASAHKGR